MAFSRDPYHPNNAFSDLVGEGTYIGPEMQDPPWDPGTYSVGSGSRDPLGTATKILKRARSKRRRTASRVVVGVTDTTMRSFKPHLRHVVGDDGVNTPVFNSLYRQFADVLPSPKLARVDDVMSYADFRASRRAPYMSNFESRLNALPDNDSGDFSAVLRQFLDETMRGGSAIHLPIPECRTGQIECWLDGDEILCTVRFSCGDGRMRMVTSGTSVADHANEVVGHAVAIGAAAEDVMTVGPSVVQVLGAAKLVEDICAVAPTVIDSCNGRSATVGLVSATDPSIAAAMSLLQRCQQGDWSAIADVKRLSYDRGDLLNDAANRLKTAQSMLAAGRL